MSDGGDVRDQRVKLLDHRGHTVLEFLRRAYYEDSQWRWDEWSVAVAPRSRAVLAHPNRPRPSDVDTPERFLVTLPEGRRVLQLPGLTLRWERVTPALDVFVAAVGDTSTLTVDQLRVAVGFKP